LFFSAPKPFVGLPVSWSNVYPKITVMKKSILLMFAVIAMGFAACSSDGNADQSGDTTMTDTTMMDDPTMSADTGMVDTMGMADTTAMDTTGTMR
jgi:hypothetical protein